MPLSCVFAKDGPLDNSSAGQFQLEVNEINSPQITNPFVDCAFRVAWKQWTLVGEPVHDTVVRWQIDQNASFHFKDREGHPVLLFASQVPLNILKQVDGIDVRIDAAVDLNLDGWQAHQQSRDKGIPTDVTLYIELNAGVLGKPVISDRIAGGQQGTDNFNVPTSPNWDKIFYYRSRGNKIYLGADQAKRIVQHGFAINAIGKGSRVSKLDINILPVIQYYNDQLKQQRDRDLNEKQGVAKGKMQERHRQQRQAAQPHNAKRTQGKVEEEDFFAELDNDLAAVDMRRTQEREVAKLEADQKQERADNHSADLRYEKVLAEEGTRLEKRLDQWRKEVEGRSLSTETLVLFDNNRTLNNKRFAYKNNNGQVVIPANYTYAGKFLEGYASVCQGLNGCGIIDRKGQVVIPLNSDHTKVLGDNYFLISYILSIGRSLILISASF